MDYKEAKRKAIRFVGLEMMKVNQCGVYCLYKDGEPKYIGVSNCIDVRVFEHIVKGLTQTHSNKIINDVFSGDWSIKILTHFEQASKDYLNSLKEDYMKKLGMKEDKSLQDRVRDIGVQHLGQTLSNDEYKLLRAKLKSEGVKFPKQRNVYVLRDTMKKYGWDCEVIEDHYRRFFVIHSV